MPGTFELRGYGFGPYFPVSFDHHNLVNGVDSAGSTYFAYVAPFGSRIYSPVTSLIEFANSQTAVKRGLGLDGGVFGLATDPDLLKFDPVTALLASDDTTHREGARVAAANLRALTAAIGVEAVQQGSYNPYYVQGASYKFVGEYLAAHDVFLFDNAVMTDILTSAVPAGKYRADVLSAAAHLIDAYAAAIGVQIDTPASATQFNLGLTGYLRIRLAQLLAANTADAANEALAVTAPQIITQTTVFREVLPFPATGFFFPAPDFFIAPAGAPLVIIADGTVGPNSGSVIANDLYANGPTGSIGFFPSTSTVLSVAVPSANTAALSATLASGKITVTALKGFKGYSYFDYSVQHPSGETGAARIYVSFQ